MSTRLRLRLLLAMPALGVLMLGFGLVLGAPRPVHGARIWGGPTDANRLAWRVELVSSDERGARPVPGVEVTVTAVSGAPAPARGVTDAAGIGEVVLERATTGPLDVAVVESATHREVARGRVELSPTQWSMRAKRRGGWLDGHRKGPLRIALAPVRGALAVSFEDHLAVLVLDAKGQPVDAFLELVCEGANVPSPSAKTDASGRAAMVIVPTDHAPTCSVNARTGDATGSFSAALPIVPGALNARRRGDAIWVESAIPSSVAYVALVTSTSRLGAHAVRLSGSGSRYQGVHPLAEAERQAEFAVVSSEPDFQSPALVGWPLDALPLASPAHTFDVRDVRLLDGIPRVLEREADRRRAVLWRVAIGIGIVGVSTLVLLWRAGRESEPLQAGGARLGASSAWLYVGMGVLALAFVAFMLAAWLGID